MPYPIITDAQIDKVVGVLRAQLLLRAAEIPAGTLDGALNDLGQDLFEVLLKRVKTAGDIHEVEVDYDDPAWRKNDRNADMAYFALHQNGIKPVWYRLLDFGYSPYDDEVIATMAEWDCRQPDRAEAETIIRRFTDDTLWAHPVVGLIGPAVRGDNGLFRGYVVGSGGRIRLTVDRADRRCDQRCRFVAIVKQTRP